MLRDSSKRIKGNGKISWFDIEKQKTHVGLKQWLIKQPK